MNQIDKVLTNNLQTTSGEILEERVGELPLIVAQIEGKGFSDIEDLLTSKGAKRLGEGAFGVVYGKEGGWVIKISKGDLFYEEFYKIAIQNRNNSIFPKFNLDSHKEWKVTSTLSGEEITHRSYGMEEFDSGLESAFWLKEQIPDLQRSKGQFALNYLIQDFEELEKRKEIFGNQYEDLLAYLREVNKIPNIRWDVHQDNFGFRKNGELVIFDPVSLRSSNR